MHRKKPSFLAKKSKGFTLLELLVVLSILMIVVTTAAPSIMSLYARMSIDSMASSLIEGIRLARMHADNRQSRVAICAGTPEVRCGGTDWSTGWTIFYSDLEVAGDSLVTLAFQDASGTPLRVVSGDLFSTGMLVFDGTGVLASTGVTQGDIVFCHEASDETMRVDIFPTGQNRGVELVKPRACGG